MKDFLFGAAVYPLLEIIYRGRTHYSMAIAGGTGLCLIHRINRLQCSLITKALISSLCITCTEYICGKIWNRTYAVWDYRNMPMNYQGQVCLPYTLVWWALSAGILFVLKND